MSRDGGEQVMVWDLSWKGRREGNGGEYPGRGERAIFSFGKARSEEEVREER
jgi:hypothetical protein